MMTAAAPIPAATGAAAPQLTRKLHCRVVAKGSAQPQTHLGDLPPVNMHGALGFGESSDATTTATLLLGTLGACLMERIRANATIGGISVGHLELHIEADIASHTLWGDVGHQPKAVGLESIQIRVQTDAKAPEAALRTLINHAVLWSPVANTLHAPIHLDVALVPLAVS